MIRLSPDLADRVVATYDQVRQELGRAPAMAEVWRALCARRQKHPCWINAQRILQARGKALADGRAIRWTRPGGRVARPPRLQNPRGVMVSVEEARANAKQMFDTYHPELNDQADTTEAYNARLERERRARQQAADDRLGSSPK